MISAKDLLKVENKIEDEMGRHEMLKQQIEAFNLREGTLTDYDCPVCHNKGSVLKLVYNETFNEYREVMCQCECMKKRAIIKRAKESGLGDYIHKRIEDYIATEDWQKDIKQKAIDYIKENDDKWFVMLGQSGSGKTLICSIIANYLLMSRNVMYITWTDFISQLKRDMMGDNSNEVTTYLDNIKKCDVLFIDELLKKYNDTDLKYIIEIINYRYTNNLKTIITSERLLDELIDIDEATFSRVIEMAGKYVSFVKKDKTKNYRLKSMPQVSL